MRILVIADSFLDTDIVTDAFEAELPDAKVEAVSWLSHFRPAELTKVVLDLETMGPDAASAKYDIDILEKIETFNPDFIVTHFAPITREIIDTAVNVKAVGVMRGGTENVDLAAARAKGVDVLNTPGRNANAVAEFTVGLILAEIKNIARGHGALKAGNWRKDYATGSFGFEVEGKTIGLVGFGKIARLVSKMLVDGFSCKVLAYDPFVSSEHMQECGVTKVELDDIFPRVDIVSVHARLTPETQGLIGKEQLNAMKPQSFLINTSRAGLVDKDALYDALSSGRIMGAALDVFWEEPIDASYPFVGLDNVTLTPHYAGSTYEAFEKAPAMLAKEVKDYHFNSDRSFVVNK